MKYLTKNICGEFHKALLLTSPDLNPVILLGGDSIFQILHTMKLKDTQSLVQSNMASVLNSRTQTRLLQVQSFLLIQSSPFVSLLPRLHPTSSLFLKVYGISCFSKYATLIHMILTMTFQGKWGKDSSDFTDKQADPQWLSDTSS